MKTLKSQWLILLILTIVILFSLKAFLIPGLYTSHDGETHTARLANYYLALSEGQFPPALAPTLYGGLGYPIFIFIYPLPYLIGSIFHALGITYTDSFELTLALAHLGSGLLFYLFLKLETRKTLPSILGALFFTFAPYRFLMLFVRAAYAESFSYLFIAATFLSLNRLFHSRSWRWTGITGLMLAGLLLSHQLSAIMFLPLLTWYSLIKIKSTSKSRQNLFLQLITSLILGLTISAFIYAPAFLERQYLTFDQALDYTREHFVTLRQLIRSPWSYGFSMPGTANDDMSFQIGLTHLSAVAIALIYILVRISKHRLQSFRDTDWFTLVAWFIPFTLSILLMLDHPINYWLFKHIPILNFIDFPWRFLGVAITAASFIVTYLTKLKPNFLLYLFFFTFIFYANRNHMRINEPLVRNDEHFDSYISTATFRNEFQSKWRQSGKFEGITGDLSLTDSLPIPPHTILDSRTHSLKLNLTASESANLILHRLYFPGWQVYLNGALQPLDSGTLSISGYQDRTNDIDYSGLLELKVPQGTHTIEAIFTPSPVRQLGLCLTVIGLLTSLLLIILPTFTHKSTQSPTKPKA